MQWQDIVRRDPYLAGNIAARCYAWWKPEGGPEAAAHACGLQEGEEAYAEFLRGWEDELKDAGIEQLRHALAEQAAIMKKAEEKGDPEVW